ncbi:MAG: ribosome silencing factor [Prochlorotrichaceae cyanobacterium]|jgi:ribosome-associated protein
MNKPAQTADPVTLENVTAPYAEHLDEALQIALVAAQAADDRKAENIRVVQVTAVSYLADYFVVVSGFSPVQVKAIARAIEAAVESDCGRSVLRQEGLAEGRWVLQDYGDVVVHIFMPEEREYYGLEAFWGHGQILDWQAQMSTAHPE